MFRALSDELFSFYCPLVGEALTFVVGCVTRGEVDISSSSKDPRPSKEEKAPSDGKKRGKEKDKDGPDKKGNKKGEKRGGVNSTPTAAVGNESSPSGGGAAGAGGGGPGSVGSGFGPKQRVLVRPFVRALAEGTLDLLLALMRLDYQGVVGGVVPRLPSDLSLLQVIETASSTTWDLFHCPGHLASVYIDFSFINVSMVDCLFFLSPPGCGISQRCVSG